MARPWSPRPRAPLACFSLDLALCDDEDRNELLFPRAVMNADSVSLLLCREKNPDDGTGGKGDVDGTTGRPTPCPTMIGKAREPELWVQHTYVVILVSLYCT